MRAARNAALWRNIRGCLWSLFIIFVLPCYGAQSAGWRMKKLQGASSTVESAFRDFHFHDVDLFEIAERRSGREQTDTPHWPPLIVPHIRLEAKDY
jgi:hypothetical protein